MLYYVCMTMMNERDAREYDTCARNVELRNVAHNVIDVFQSNMTENTIMLKKKNDFATYDEYCAYRRDRLIARANKWNARINDQTKIERKRARLERLNAQREKIERELNASKIASQSNVTNANDANKHNASNIKTRNA